jgi:hypothetical protein
MIGIFICICLETLRQIVFTRNKFQVTKHRPWQCHSLCFPPSDPRIDSSMYTQQNQAGTDFIYRDFPCQSPLDYLSSIVLTPHNLSIQYSVVKNMTLSFNECNQSLKFVTNNRLGRRVTQFAQIRKTAAVT